MNYLQEKKEGGGDASIIKYLYNSIQHDNNSIEQKLTLYWYVFLQSCVHDEWEE